MVARAREKLPSFYSLSGSRATIKADVEWLIDDSHFIFADVDLKVWVHLPETQMKKSSHLLSIVLLTMQLPLILS
jgi:hypothetical protein